MIKVYTTETCIYCHALMEWLDDEGIKYKELDASEGEGITSVPFTVITDKKGNTIAEILGFDRPAIKKALKEVENA
ncbi:MAG: glutaredoxin family protein [Candidatus Saccharibacteria bacterium]|nr:glutaredoxin family protein [Candidatus Saccharibacteria bacterium]